MARDEFTNATPPTTYPAPAGYPAPTGYPVAPPFRGPYGAQPAYTPPPPQGTPGIVVVGFVLAFVAPLVGLIVSIIALARVRRSGSPGRGLAITGIVVPSLMLVAAIAIPIYLNVRDRGEAAPRGAFRDMEASLLAGSCAAFQARTTANFQYQLGLTDCAQFDAYVAEVNAMGGFGTVPIVDIVLDGDVATVTTTERVDWGDGEPVIENVDYTVVRTDGGWRVDSYAFAD